jgi:putative transposase
MFYKWLAKYGGKDVYMISRMKEFEDENRRLKKMYLKEKLKAEIVSEVLEKKWLGHLADGRCPRRR